jgi:catechol 2,3-dioxygenase-like lactoylglutathione lyase family enzyme
MQLTKVTLVVRDYDEAITWYVSRLGFVVREDVPMPDQGKRWVVVGPPGGGPGFVLGRATSDAQLAAVGNQTGGRVFLFLGTDDFTRDFDRLVAHGTTIVRGPIAEPYGTVAVFADLYGNLWDLVGPPA